MPALLKMVGGLVPTYLLSRLFFRLFRTKRSDGLELSLAHIASWVVCAALAGWGAADGGPYKWDAGIIYILPQMAWFIVDVYRADQPPKK